MAVLKMSNLNKFYFNYKFCKNILKKIFYKIIIDFNCENIVIKNCRNI